MNFYDRLRADTSDARDALFAAPVISDCMNGRVGLESYRAFLTEAYHHVSHTVPLLMACGSRLPRRLDWLGEHLVKYINEELGHEKWIRHDIEATGADSASLLAAGPSIPTELMISYAYDTIERGNPLGFFGMVYVLEGTSVSLATRAADIIQRALALPNAAFSYLRSHGVVDMDHIAGFEQIVNRFDRKEDREAVSHAARVFFRLYGDIFNSLPRAAAGESIEQDRDVA